MPRRLPLAVFALLLATAAGAAPKPRPAEADIRAALDSTSAGWNRGDLKTYLAYYTPDALEMGRSGEPPYRPARRGGGD